MDPLARLGALALELQLGARREAAPDFVEWAFEALKRHLPFDTALWATGYAEPGQMPQLHTNHLHRQPAQMLVDYQAIGPSDVLLAAAMRQPGVPVVADTPTWAPPQVLGYLRRYGIAHAMATCTFDPVTALCCGISLWRAEADKPFSDDERRLMQAAFPLLLDACTQNRLLHLVTESTSRWAGPWRPAAADRAGLLHLADTEFTRLLTLEHPGWTGPYLSDPLRQAVRDGGPLRLTSRQLVAKLAPMGELMLVQLRPAGVVDRLTVREREIAGYTAQGLTHKEIARLLELSPATVRTHINTSCRRLGVKNKAQMAALVLSLD